MRINAFRAWRPDSGMAEDVACVAYDTVNRDEAKELVEGNENSFLHVVRPESGMPATTDPYSDEVYKQALASFNDLRSRGVLVRDEEPALYVYRQKVGEHVQCGVVGCCCVDDYRSGLIKKHEKSREDKLRDRIRMVKGVRANTGPVFLVYRDNAEVDAIVSEVERGASDFCFVADDGVEHAGWRVSDSAALEKAFEGVDCFYIADGHHRAAAASESERELQDEGQGSEAASLFLVSVVPAGQVRVMAYNRCVADLGGMTSDEFMCKVGSAFEVTEKADSEPCGGGRASMYIDGKWYGLSWAVSGLDDEVIERLDVSVLQSRLLSPILGIGDVRTDSRISFVGGIRGTQELERLVDSGRTRVAFSMYPVTAGEMMDVADAGSIMPPKSTWFEPKLRSGLFVHEL